jgi:hypothetical protein
MTKIFLFIAFCFCSFNATLLAQTVIERQSISAGGSSFEMANETYMVSATIGQPAAGNFSNENYIVTAGFQQSGLTLVNAFTAENAGVSVFPNPGTDFVMIKSDLQDYSVKVYDVRGAVVFSKTKTNGNFVVDVTSFKAGEYILQLTNSVGNLLSSTKLIKN